jgi:hypothetical protein
MAKNIFLDELNNKDLMNTFGVREDNAPLTPEELAQLSTQAPEVVVPQAAPIVAPKIYTQKSTAQDTTPQVPAPPTKDDTDDTETPMSKSEALIAEYQKMLGKDQQSLEEARSRDRMLKIGGSIGDALATYLNAKSQMNVKAPGVQVQQGAGLGKVADMFATAPEIASDVTARREALLKQYAELAKGERSQAAVTSKEKIAEERNKTLKEAAGIAASRGNQNLDLRKQQYAQLGDSQVEKLSILKSGIDQASMLLPQLEKARNSLGIIGTPLAEVETKFGKNPEFQKLKQDYASLRNTIRKDIFGATLTPGEATEFDNELAKIGISEKQLGTAIQGLIDRTKLKARSRLNTIAETQPLKAETARNAIKTFGLEDDTPQEEAIGTKIKIKAPSGKIKEVSKQTAEEYLKRPGYSKVE